MTASDQDEPEIDEMAARCDDLVEKLTRDIAEGCYPPYITLRALLRVTVAHLLGYEETAAREFSWYVSDLDAEFDAGLNHLPPYDGTES
jgi:hypothetical protein